MPALPATLETPPPPAPPRGEPPPDVVPPTLDCVVAPPIDGLDVVRVPEVPPIVELEDVPPLVRLVIPPAPDRPPISTDCVPLCWVPPEWIGEPLLAPLDRPPPRGSLDGSSASSVVRAPHPANANVMNV